MNPETILPCPNPECGKACELLQGIMPQIWWVACDIENGCGYRSGAADREWKAIRLHNALCRPQADWSAAAREIHAIVSKAWKGREDYFSISETEAIIRKHQSQPSAPESRETLEHVHILNKQALVTGDPQDLPDSVPDDDPRRHNCDAMGCPTLDHVLYRLPFTDHRKPEEIGLDAVLKTADAKALAKQLAESIDFTAGPVQAREAFEKVLGAMQFPSSPVPSQEPVAWKVITERGDWYRGPGSNGPDFYTDYNKANWEANRISGSLQPLFTHPGIVPGWVLVPREPTEEMELAGREFARSHDPSTFGGIFQAMVAAAPKVKP